MLNRWQPPDTAPRTGDKIMLLLNGGSWCDGWYCDDEDVWVCCDARFEIEHFEVEGWQPMPEVD